MVKLHATVGFEDERLAHFRVIGADDRIERDLHIFRHPEVPELAHGHLGLAVQKVDDGGAHDLGHRLALVGGNLLETGEMLGFKPYGSSIFGLFQTNLLAGRMVVASQGLSYATGALKAIDPGRSQRKSEPVGTSQNHGNLPFLKAVRTGC